MRHQDDPTADLRDELRELNKMVADTRGALAELKRTVEEMERKVDLMRKDVDHLTHRRYTIVGWCEGCGMAAADCKCHPEGERP